jgi:glucose-6-phosphate 1-epimerase
MGDEEHPMYSEIKNDHGQSILRLMHPAGGVCEVYLFGATVTKFTTDSGREVIWLSSTAKLDGTKAIRGGIPLVFPHFGQPIKEMAQHGFARNNTWKIKEYPANKQEPGGRVSSDSVWVQCILSLDNTMATHEAWPHPYELQLVIKLFPKKLITEYVVTNTGDAPFRFQSLQHTYLEVQDIGATSIYGLDGGRFMDKTSENPSDRNIDPRSKATIGEFTDRVYTNLTGREGVVVATPNGDVRITGSGELTVDDMLRNSTCDVVMWNPWAEKAAGMADFDDEGYKRMLCIEPGVVSDFHVLPPKASFNLKQILDTAED